MDILVGIVIGVVLTVIVLASLIRSGPAEPECQHEWKETDRKERFSIWPSCFYYKQSPPCRVWYKCSKCNKTMVEDYN